MRHLLHYILVLGFVWSPPLLAFEGDKDESFIEDWEDFNSFEMKRKGKEGIWFPIQMANDVLKDLEHCDLTVRELHIHQEKITLLDTQLELRNQRIADLRGAIILSKKVEAAMQETIVLSEASRQRAEENVRRAEASRDAWYRHPVLWFTIGVAITVVGGVVVKKVID